MDTSMEFVRKMPLPQEIKRDYPADRAIRTVKETRDREIADVLPGKDPRLLLLIGPCSADRLDAVLDYMERLRKVQDKVADKIARFAEEEGLQGHARSVLVRREQKNKRG